jgi:hypothetical protein
MGILQKTHKHLLLLFVLYISAISAIFSGNVPKKLRYGLQRENVCEAYLQWFNIIKVFTL